MSNGNVAGGMDTGMDTIFAGEPSAHGVSINEARAYRRANVCKAQAQHLVMGLVSVDPFFACHGLRARVAIGSRYA